MFSKVIFFALLATAIAGIPQFRVGLRMPPISPPFSPQIVGGEEAPVGGYPYIVSLQAYGQHFCAGSILNENWVLTAAHCVQALPSLDILRVKAGKHYIEESEDTEQTVKVTKSFVHESYGGGVGPYDIGLFKLASPLSFNKRVQPIQLASPDSDPQGEALLCGWGSTSASFVPKMPNALQHIKLEYVNRDICHRNVERLTGSSPVHETNVCTGPLGGGISACSGDSGGPLISLNGDKVIQTGIVSWGIIPCGTVGAPSVYARTSKFNSWIEEKINNY